MFLLVWFSWVFSPFYIFLQSLSLCLGSSSTQTCEIRSVLLVAPNIPQQMDLHQVQTVTNFELLFPISAEKFPSCLTDVACWSLRLLLSEPPLFCAFSSCCSGPGDTRETEKQK